MTRYALDDNYATRMVAGGEWHDHSIPLPAEALQVARANLRTQRAAARVPLFPFAASMRAEGRAFSRDARRGIGVRSREGRALRYAVVGTLESQAASLCVLAGVLGASVVPTKGDQKKGPTTHTRKSGFAADFMDAFAGYLALDDGLYGEAAALLEAHLDVFPRCRK